MNPWTLLGLDADADTRSIKRRYAQLLKQHRPDEDTEAFQRLREAYEQALAHAAAEDRSRNAGSEQRQVPAVASTLVVEDEPVVAAATEAPAHARLEQLLEANDSLDAALQQAREQGLETDLQRYLLARCATLDEEGLNILRWGMQRLQWLSPWQAEYLPRAHSEALAARLLAVELETLQQRLQAGEERAVVDAATALLASDWLQSFDRRRQLQDGMVWMLEVTDHWTGGLFDRLCRLFGWNEDTGELPCSVERWNWLCWRCERHAVGQRVQQHLQLDWPLRAEERAAWLLLKSLNERDTRQLVDRFDAEDWQACDALEHMLTERYPELPELLDLQIDEDWWRWQPRQWTVPATVYAWLMLFTAMFATSLQDAQMSVYLERSGGYLGLGLKDLLISVGMVAWMVMLARGWSRLARYLTRLDVPLSRLLLPAVWRDRGAGMLVLRHGLPAALFAMIVTSFAPSLVPGGVVFGAALLLEVLFLGLVGGRRMPWPRWSLWRTGAFKVDYSKKAEW
ncbi:J domain-containing protein [Pseudomonas fulva]|uniref:J domain-containing protein n=1 Tax=Pseudomonas fulva TaxID=47880 RepID=UPI00201DCA3E|nr:J domain-containing protein [Pseudomonas fulva]UQY32579.1 J domain-containing protein [Pseudomonas fulva]